MPQIKITPALWPMIRRYQGRELFPPAALVCLLFALVLKHFVNEGELA